MPESSPLVPSSLPPGELMTSAVEALSSERPQPVPLPIRPRTDAPLAILSDAQRQAAAMGSMGPEAASPDPLSGTALEAGTGQSVSAPDECRSRLRLRLTALGFVCLSGIGVIWMASRGPQALSAIQTADLDFGPELVPREVSHIGLHNLSDLDPHELTFSYAVLLKPTNRRQTLALRRYLPQAKLEQRQPLGTLLRVDLFRTAAAAAVYNQELRRLGYNSWVEKRS
jgi:hypothetical protein